MSLYLYGYATDGYGDRDDILLAKDRDQSRIRENVYKDQMRSFDVSSLDYAKNEEDGIPISKIVKHLVQRGGGQRLYYNNQIFWDMELQEAREEACISAITPDGWDEPVTELEQIVVDGRGDGHEYEISVELYAETEEASPKDADEIAGKSS